MTFNEGTENFDVKNEKFDDAGIIAREYKKTRFVLNRTENIDIPYIDILEGKTNKNNKNNIFQSKPRANLTPLWLFFICPFHCIQKKWLKGFLKIFTLNIRLFFVLQSYNVHILSLFCNYLQKEISASIAL